MDIFNRICKKWKSYSEFQILSWTPAYLYYSDNVYKSDDAKNALLPMDLDI